MPEQNPFTEAALEVGRGLAARRKEAFEAKVIPFGEQKVTPQQLWERLQRDDTLMQQTIAQPGGSTKVLELWRRYGKGK